MSEVAPTLARLEAELAATIEERSSELAHLVAVALAELAAQERAARNGGARPAGPRLCTACRVRLAAEQRTICHSCRRRRRNERARLRQAAAEERQAALNSQRGERARQLVAGERQNPAPVRRLEA